MPPPSVPDPTAAPSVAVAVSVGPVVSVAGAVVGERGAHNEEQGDKEGLGGGAIKVKKDLR